MAVVEKSADQERAAERAYAAAEQTSLSHARINEEQERIGRRGLDRSYTTMMIVQDALAAYEDQMSGVARSQWVELQEVPQSEVSRITRELYDRFVTSYNVRFRPSGVTFTEADRMFFLDIAGEALRDLVSQAQEFRTSGS